MKKAGRYSMCHNKKGMNILREISGCMYVYEEVEEFEKTIGDLMEDQGRKLVVIYIQV
jgi:hypothetical protein